MNYCKIEGGWGWIGSVGTNDKKDKGWCTGGNNRGEEKQNGNFW